MRGSTPRSRAVWVRLLLLRSSTSTTYWRWKILFGRHNHHLRLDAELQILRTVHGARGRS